MTQANVHLIEDESLGGLLREYVESDRKADVGDYVVITYFEGESVAHIAKVTDTDADANQFDFTPGISGDFSNDHLFDYDYETCKTLDPTDIVHVDGVRYKLVDRKAEVGEKVVVTNGGGWYSNRVGEIFKVINGEELGFYYAKDKEYVHVDEESNQHSWSICFIRDKNYLVLEPVNKAEIYVDGKKAAEMPLYVDESQASPEVIEMLGNLAVRINELERQIDVLKKRQVLDNIQTLKRGHDRLSEEIDTLHSNQKRMAEELENAKAVEVTAPTFDIDSAEVIVELAKLLARESRKVGR